MDLYQSLVTVNPVTLIAQICNLFIQLFLAKKFFLDKVKAILDQRREAADKEITDAKAAHAEAEAIKQTYEQNMKEARAKADDLLMNRVLGRPGGRPHGVQRGGLLATTTGQPAPPGPHCPHWAQGDLVAAGLGGRLPPRLACLLQVPGPPLTPPTPISCPVSPS